MIDIYHYSSYKGHFQLDFGADACGGVAGYLDDALFYEGNYDHWWDNRWNNPFAVPHAAYNS
jgi:hypothetical protein